MLIAASSKLVNRSIATMAISNDEAVHALILGASLKSTSPQSQLLVLVST